jgi:RNA polymerase primary sigma factor
VHEASAEDWENDENAVVASDAGLGREDISHPSNDIVRPDLVERVLRSLAADAARGDGQLKRTDINRAYLRKDLSIAECMEVERRLMAADCIIVESDSEDSSDDDPAGEAGPERRVRYLTHAEERDLGRRIQLAAQLPADTSHLGVEYVRRIKRDAESARSTFVNTNLRYVEMLARRRGEPRYIAIDDLKQEGFIGLLRAVELYDPELGFRFKTYATWWIEQRIHRALADENRMIRLPVYVQEKMVKIRRARTRLTLANGGKAPTEGELADALGVDRERLTRLLWRVQATDAAEGDALIGEDISALSLVPDEGASQLDILMHRDLQDQLRELRSALSPREERIIRMRFGIGLDRDYTLESIGEEYSLTRERIRQIEAKALRKLQHPAKRSRLRGFLDS